jgi:glycosyltransferase involved in cell wall biosynthesis
MRIVYVCPRYPPSRGGVETHVSEIASRLARRGHEVEVLTQARDDADEVEELAGATVRRFPTVVLAGRRAIPWRLWRYLRAGSWDVVHAHDFGRPTALAAAFPGPEPLVFTPHFHGTGEPETPTQRLLDRAHRRAIRLILGRAACVICVSEAESELLLHDFPSAIERLVVIPNGTSRRPANDARRTHKPLILSVGRVESYKNIDALIAALTHLPAQFKLQVIGDGSARSALAAKAAEEGKGDRVEFLGQVDDGRLDRALAESGVLATMSDREAFGLAVLDALAAGVPVVASEIPAHRELCDRYGGENMRLLPLDASPVELARAIEAVMRDRGSPPETIPTWDRVANLTLGVYESVVRSGRQ